MFKKILVVVCSFLSLSLCYASDPLVKTGMDIVIEGKVLKNTPKTLTLKNVSGENVLVRARNKKSFAANKKIENGDEVIVYGRVENDHKEGTIVSAEKIKFK